MTFHGTQNYLYLNAVYVAYVICGTMNTVFTEHNAEKNACVLFNKFIVSVH